MKLHFVPFETICHANTRHGSMKFSNRLLFVCGLKFDTLWGSTRSFEHCKDWLCVTNRGVVGRERIYTLSCFRL